jgi:hypothetical protein
MTCTIPQQLIVNQLVEFIKAPESSHFSLPAHATLKSGSGLATAVRVRRFDRYTDGRLELERRRRPHLRDHPLPPLDFQNRPKSKPGGKMAFARACPLPDLATDLQTIAVVVRYFLPDFLCVDLQATRCVRSDND